MLIWALICPFQSSINCRRIYEPRRRRWPHRGWCLESHSVCSCWADLSLCSPDSTVVCRHRTRTRVASGSPCPSCLSTSAPLATPVPRIHAHEQDSTQTKQTKFLNHRKGSSIKCHQRGGVETSVSEFLSHKCNRPWYWKLMKIYLHRVPKTSTFYFLNNSVKN